MKLRKTLAAAGALAIAGGMAVIQPANAACTSPAGGDCTETTVTFSVTGGTLSFTAERPTASLTYASSVLAGTTASGNLGTFTIEDTRNSSSGWSVTADSTDFNRVNDGATPTPNAVNAATTPEDDTIEDELVAISIDASNVDAVLSNLVDGQAFAPTAGTDGATAGPIGNLTVNLATLGLLPNNSKVVYDPTVTVTIPAGTPNGSYQGVVTQTVS